MVVRDDGECEPAAGTGTAIAAEGLGARNMAGLDKDAIPISVLPKAMSFGERAHQRSGQRFAV